MLINNYCLFVWQRALRNKAMEMPEPTQWDNDDSESTAVELKDHLDSVPCTESEDDSGSDDNWTRFPKFEFRPFNFLRLCKEFIDFLLFQMPTSSVSSSITEMFFSRNK